MVDLGAGMGLMEALLRATTHGSAGLQASVPVVTTAQRLDSASHATFALALGVHPTPFPCRFSVRAAK